MSGPCVLVTDGESRAALAAVRSLGAAGYRVHVAARDRRNLAGASRYASGEHWIGDAASEPEAWSQELEALADRISADYVLPITEVAIGTLFETGVCERRDVVCPPRAAYEAAVDKHGLMERAVGLDLRAPASRLVETPAALDALPEGFAYPVVLKARRSRFLRGGRWVAGDARIARDRDELRRAAAAPGLAAGALLQEFVPGHGEAIFALAEEGRILASFAHRRLREKPPTGGESVLREAIPPDPRLLAGSERLLEDLGWSGVAMVEFRRPPGGEPALMEINPRLWGSLQLAIDAGVDFPALMLARHRGRPIPPLVPRFGARCRWLLGDLDHLLICLRRPESRAATGRGVVRVVADFLRSFLDGSRQEVCRRDDWRPFLRELSAWRP